jgi:hypothetical protein
VNPRDEKEELMSEKIIKIFLFCCYLMIYNESFSQSNYSKIDSLENYYSSLRPTSGTIELGCNTLFGVTNARLLGYKINDFVNSENNFLNSLGLTFTKAGSTTPINSYDYPTPLYLNFKGLYYINNNLGIGVIFNIYQQQQKLWINGKSYDGDLVYFTNIGFCGKVAVWQKKRLVFNVCPDIGYISGSANTVPALYAINGTTNFTFPWTLTNYISLVHQTNDINGFQFNTTGSFEYALASWLDINAGIDIHYLHVSISHYLWDKSQDSFNDLSVGVSLGLSMYWNKSND